jgi:hypothetical protein
MIKVSEIYTKVVELATKYPNASYFRYADFCHNVLGKVSNGPEETGCIIGQSIRQIDSTFFDTNPLSGKSSIYGLVNDGLIQNDDEALFMKLRKIQSNQDMSISWGECIRDV